MSLVRRYPVASFLLIAHLVFWVSWTPTLFGAPPRLFSAVGACLGLALPALLVTAVVDGRAGVRDLLQRALRWRVDVGWYLLALFIVPLGALLAAPMFLGAAPLEALSREWLLLFTAFLPQLLLALVTVQFFEELGWSGFVQERLQRRHGALKGTVLVGLAFATLHLITYIRLPLTGQQVLQVIAQQALLIIPFSILFRAFIAWTYNKTRFAILIAALAHASFNASSEIISPIVSGPVAQVLAIGVVAVVAIGVTGWTRGKLGYQRNSVKGTDTKAHRA